MPVFEQVLEQYPESVRIVFKNFPLSFHKEAMPAALAALAADGQGRFWEMHDLLFENSSQLSKSKIDELAASLGLDMTRFRYDVTSNFVGQWLNRDVQAGLEAGVTGTPAVFVNGRKLKDRSLSGFKKLINNELAKTVKEVKE